MNWKPEMKGMFLIHCFLIKWGWGSSMEKVIQHSCVMYNSSMSSSGERIVTKSHYFGIIQSAFLSFLPFPYLLSFLCKNGLIIWLKIPLPGFAVSTLSCHNLPASSECLLVTQKGFFCLFVVEGFCWFCSGFLNKLFTLR